MLGSIYGKMKWLISDDKWVYILLEAQIFIWNFEWFKENDKFGEFGCVPENVFFFFQKQKIGQKQ